VKGTRGKDDKIPGHHGNNDGPVQEGYVDIEPDSTRILET
jgi:hypothetical protein